MEETNCFWTSESAMKFQFLGHRAPRKDVNNYKKKQDKTKTR